jgi:hypothetical protein
LEKDWPLDSSRAGSQFAKPKKPMVWKKLKTMSMMVRRA